MCVCVHKQSNEIEPIISTFINYNEYTLDSNWDEHCIRQSNFVHEFQNLNTEKRGDFANQMIGRTVRLSVGRSVGQCPNTL